jgi:hypothetical protein
MAAKVPNSARAIVTGFLNQYGLGGLAGWAWNVYRQNGGGNLGIQAITNELPNQDIFQQRFPNYVKLAEKGFSLNQQISYQQNARELFHNAGLPDGFYDSPAELSQFMLHGVSANELGNRIQLASQASISMAPDVRSQLTDMFGMQPGHLTAFFLDPDTALPLIQKEFTAAQIGSESTRAGVGQLSAGQATGLAELGVTDAQAQSGFQKLGLEQGLFQQQTTGEQAIGLDQQLAAQFGGQGSTAAELAFQQRAAQRKAAFNEDTGFSAQQGGIGGLKATVQ